MAAQVRILGRDAELAAIEEWLRAAREPVLLIQGVAGIGKTTLWAETIRRAQDGGWQVLSCRPARSDAGLPQVGLADLLEPVPDEVFAELPVPQRRPLEVALLREESADGDLEPRAVGTGLTRLLAALADTAPLLIAIDDAQWLDLASARSVAFALRRLADRQVQMVTAMRTSGKEAPEPVRRNPLEALLDGLAVRRIALGPLTVAGIHQLFLSAIGSSFPRPVLVRIHAAAGGNPFYSLEIARELMRQGLPPSGQPLPVPADHADLALLRMRRLPRTTRETLAVVAAMARPMAGGLDLLALAPAERAGIVRVDPGGRVEFTHPLFASALYSSLPEADRRSLHQSLAAMADSPEERARHLALAADGPDERTAAELDRAAAAASARGAAEIAVELKELAFLLTPAADPHVLARRELELADRRYFAGDPNGAREQLEQSLTRLPAGEDRASAQLELGSVLWAQGQADLGMHYLSAALGEAQARDLRARIHSRISALADDCDVSVQHGEAALALLDEAADPMLYSFALHNVALFKLYAGRGADHDAIDKGMALQRDVSAWEMSTVPAFWARNFDDFAIARQRFEYLLRACREQGDEASTSGLLTHLAVIEAMTGRTGRAAELAAEALDLAGQTEQETLLNMATWATAQVLARTGDADEARAAAGMILRRLDAHPDIVFEGMARAVLGMVAVSCGNLAEADAQLSRSDDIEEILHEREPISNRFHADHAEAVIGLGDLARAAELVGRMEQRASALPRPWISAVSARCRGLLNAARGDLDEALSDYQRAMAAHASLDMPVERGRTLLAAGRLHRRRNERQRARECLAEAIADFESADARAWAAVARDELDRAGGRRGDGERLTPTERKVGELAAAGLRNSEIAARLFVADKTVEANLSRIYRKLGVRSRTELAGRLRAVLSEHDPGEP
jgi:DNA-binding CsgD family transcriptional regulator/predicted negative regulator of RcsB-dependent stress response